ncbi:MAG: LacI family DNA-binding transcriptional regulator [Vallitaleaceae bacterium]|jgi:LacI family transcriptional regulator|nr:LacI family DNA-binding transcriptional regulator [Vallitaleaceae bacterium]
MIHSEKRATIHDVAAMSGVSITTVSRVINDNYPVNVVTKKRVNEAIEALGYRPNLLARSLIRDKTQTIGILVPSIENLFFSEVIKAIDGYLSNLDYRTFLCQTGGNPLGEETMVDSLLNRSVDGIVVVDPRTKLIKSGFYEGLTRRIPLVLINGYNQGIRCNFIINNELAGTTQALEHLVLQGHKHIGFMRGKKSYSYDIKEAMYVDFMNKHQLEIDDMHLFQLPGGNDLETVKLAKESITQLFSNSTNMTAILCCNDFMAIGALNGAKTIGLSVPGGLSIIGYDNTLISQISEPPLTTVDHHMSELGDAAARRMVELISSKSAEYKKIVINTDLIVRGT